MIEFRHGDILEAEVEALVNTVNCVGVMGRGIALQFRKAFPKNYHAYKSACEHGEVRPGSMFVFDLNQYTSPRYIVNFPTKRHWRGKSRLEDIRSGLAALVAEVRKRDIQSIAIPPLGCGMGGLDWSEVRPLIEEAFREVPEVAVQLFEPSGAPAAARMVREPSIPKMTQGRAALIGLIRKYLAAVLDPFVTLLEVHKLMYFMQEAGEPLRLKYAKALYGPYAENLRHVLNTIEGYYLTGYGDAQDSPSRQLELTEAAPAAADEFLEQHPKTLARFERVAKLIAGFETPYGMELLATVHWVAAREGAKSPDEATTRVYDWNERKKMFSERHIRLAWDVLKSNGLVGDHAEQ